MIDQDLKQRWIEALRSGEYKQTKGKLKSKDGNFCCLGVLCDIEGVKLRPYAQNGKEVQTADLTDINKAAYIVSKLDLNRGDYSILSETLAEMNDDDKSFNEIADYIEKVL